MSTPIAILTADCHLDLNAWADRPGICGDSAYALSQVITRACSSGIPIIAAGDLLDKKKNLAQTISELSVNLDNLSLCGSDFLFIQGQHELQETPWIGAVASHAIHLSDRDSPWQLGCGDKTLVLFGLDWTPRELLSEKIAELNSLAEPFYASDKHVVMFVMHQVTRELMGSIVTPELLASSLLANILLVGDYHVHTTVKTVNVRGEDLRIISPGSTNIRAINEPANKAFYILNDDLSLTSIPLLCRTVVKKLLSTSAQLDEFVTTIANELKMRTESAAATGIPQSVCVPIIDVAYAEELPNAYSRIRSAVGNSGHLFMTVFLNGDEPVALDHDLHQYSQVFDDNGLVGCLSLVVPRDEDMALFDFCSRLLLTDDVDATLDNLREEFLNETARA